MNKRLLTAVSTFGAATMVFGAAALAQTTSPSDVVAPLQATGTVSTTMTAAGTGTAMSTGTALATGTASASGTTVATGTSVASGTAAATGTSVSGTAVPTGTAGASGTALPTVPVPSSIYVPGGQGNFPFADQAFQRVWQRTDQPVAQGKVQRTWFWGPGPNTPGLMEQYNEAPNGTKQRLVQYFDKSRMEINNPQADRNQAFFVTNGLLTVELISGYIQLGDKDFVKYHPACIPMSGDFGDQSAPTYFAFQKVSNTQAGDHFAPNRVGQNVTETIDRNGNLGTDPSKAAVPGTKLVQFENQTKHNIPEAFWNFLNEQGQVYNAQGALVTEPLITPLYYATGLPISEPYWAKATINGQLKDVMIQAYERRALTYVPTNQAGFQVEMANIGQHYFDWRYRNFGICPGTPATTPTAPVPATTGTPAPNATGTSVATGTAVGTGTAVATGTVSATGTAGTTATAGVTGTAVATGTAMATGTAQATGTAVGTATTTATP